jgi:hypothetical protein
MTTLVTWPLFYNNKTNQSVIVDYVGNTSAIKLLIMISGVFNTGNLSQKFQ